MGIHRRIKCNTTDHVMGRRQFLGGMAAGALTGWAALMNRSVASEVQRQGKQCILLWMAGGMSQFETLDPKLGPTGGPYRAISTSVPGIQISELLPHLSQRMDKMALVRSLNSKERDHAKGTYLMHTGYDQSPILNYPTMGAVLAKELHHPDSPLPAFVNIHPIGEGDFFESLDPAFLGPEYGPLTLDNGNLPEHIHRHQSVSAEEFAEREALRQFLSQSFHARVKRRETEMYDLAFARAGEMMAHQEAFDVSKEPEKVRRRYGTTDFQRHCMQARRLIEAGVPFVKIRRQWWDTHSENFDCHRELTKDLDWGMSVLLDDLAERGLLDNTLVVLMSEMGRTPSINHNNGRDHFGNCWSVAFAGCGIEGGQVYGRSSDNGSEAVDNEVGPSDIFATIYHALGIDPHKEYIADERPTMLTDHGNPIATLFS